MRLTSLGLILITLLAALSRPTPSVFAQCASVYVVQRGDTLGRIARQYNTTVGELTQLNGIANPNRIFTGQVLRLPGGGACPGTGSPVGTSGTQVYIVQRGDTLSRIASRYGTTVAALAAANGIVNPSRIYPGQRLLISGASASTTPVQSALPGLTLTPDPPEQGRTLMVTLPAEGRTAISGSLGAWPIHFFREGDRYVGLAGIYALASPGVYTLALTLTDAGGSVTTYAQGVRVAAGGYARENLTLSPSTTQLLDPQLTIPERERVAALVAPVTPARYWSGAFQLPAAGRITSAFGTRRSYNGGPYNSYHGGVDFSYSGGLDIYAPAPGVVVLAEALVVRGNATLIDHGWGVYSGYWHQSEIVVRAGEVVQPGQVIGKIGNTGLVTGPHLHWEIFVAGVQVDPMQWTRQTFP